MDINRFLNFRDKKQLAKDVVFWFSCGFILLFLGKLLENYYFTHVSPYIVQPSDTIKSVAFLLLVISLFIMLKFFFNRIWIFWKTKREYIFNKKDWSDKWLFNGKIELADKGLLVKSSRAGCLLKNCYWKNFKMSFEMKFDFEDRCGSQKRFGIVFRAQDLDNYFMVEIGENIEKCDNNGKLLSSIKPQVRYRGGWEIMSATEIKGAAFNFSDFVSVSLEVKNDTVCFIYEGTFVFEWVLPDYVDVNHIESGVENNKTETKEIIIGKAFVEHVQKIPFRLGYGLIGFRAHPHHVGTYIRNLKVEQL